MALKIGPTFATEMEAKRSGLSRLPFNWYPETGEIDLGDPVRVSEKDQADIKAVLAKHDPGKES